MQYRSLSASPSICFYPRPPGGGRRVPVHILRDHVEVSIHALRVEGDRGAVCSRSSLACGFYPRPPGGGRLKVGGWLSWVRFGCYPRPPGGGRQIRFQELEIEIVFLSTPSGWRATHQIVRVRGNVLFRSTPSGWRATVLCFYRQRGVCVSIHALRVEGDRLTMPKRLQRILVSIHALRVEGDDFMPVKARGQGRFYPRPPGGGRRWLQGVFKTDWTVSIHALRVEGDKVIGSAVLSTLSFYPRPPGGGRPRITRSSRPESGVSIHALRVEGDKQKTGKSFKDLMFLSTPSGWRATGYRFALP